MVVDVFPVRVGGNDKRMIAAVNSDLIQSEIALRTVSTQSHHPSRKMVDKGLEQVEQKNKVS